MKQVGAIPCRRDDDGKLRVLLITSRETGRWVIPKGWQMEGLSDWKAASKEAKQEAGVSGRMARKPIGVYEYFKRTRSTFELVEVTVFLLTVRKEHAEWQEMTERNRRWFSLRTAAQRVTEPGLKSLLRSLRTAEQPGA